MKTCKKGHEFETRQCMTCWYAWHNKYRMAKRRAAGVNPKGRGLIKPTCPRGHPKSDHLRSGRYDCVICHREDELRRTRARGAKPRPPPKTRDQELADRRRWENDRRAKKKAAWIESVDPIVVYERDCGICHICGEGIGEERWEIDHKIPLSRGGPHSYANVGLAHASCNRKKWAA